jgi:hypothetical protein
MWNSGFLPQPAPNTVSRLPVERCRPVLKDRRQPGPRVLGTPGDTAQVKEEDTVPRGRQYLLFNLISFRKKKISKKSQLNQRNKILFFNGTCPSALLPPPSYSHTRIPLEQGKVARVIHVDWDTHPEEELGSPTLPCGVPGPSLPAVDRYSLKQILTKWNLPQSPSQVNFSFCFCFRGRVERGEVHLRRCQ